MCLRREEFGRHLPTSPPHPLGKDFLVGFSLPNVPRRRQLSTQLLLPGAGTQLLSPPLPGEDFLTLKPKVLAHLLPGWAGSPNSAPPASILAAILVLLFPVPR